VKFYLGTHEVSWLGHSTVPLFVSQRRLSRLKSWPIARVGWAKDSGGFSELSMFGEWRTSMKTYINDTRRHADAIGSLQWAAIQDWMCEPFMLAKTGLDIAEHQRRTVASWADLNSAAPDVPWLPVLQGYSVDDYLRCHDLYLTAGCENVYYGVGSVCRRQGSDEIGEIFKVLSERGLQLHGFGVKTLGVRLYGEHLRSADSMAWSIDARRLGYSWCGATHINCANCFEYAMMWRNRFIT
jgi:hypothetical protein